MAKADNSGLAQRGLLLLGLMVAMVVAVWALWLRPSPQQLPAARARPELLAPLLHIPAGAFPASIGWGAVGEMAAVLPSAPGWEARYNATVALARHGSKQLPFDVLVEMLDEERQMRNFPVRLQDGRLVPDETAARRTVLQGLKALVEWHKHADAVKAVGKDSAGLRETSAAVERLTRSGNLVVRTEAEKTLSTVRKG